MLESILGQREGPDSETASLVKSLRAFHPGKIVYWNGSDGDETAAQMIEHLNRNDAVGKWYLAQVKAQGWKPDRPPDHDLYKFTWTYVMDNNGMKYVNILKLCHTLRKWRK